MSHPVVLDFGAPQVAFTFGICVLILFVPIFIIEAIILRCLKWGSLKNVLLDSLVVNMISTVLGLAFVVPIEQFIFGWLAGWGLSVVIEGGALVLLKRHSFARTFFAVLAANFSSYAWLVGLIYLLAGRQSYFR